MCPCDVCFGEAGSRTFILDKLSRENSEFRKIFIFDYKGKDGSETVTAAGGRLIEVSIFGPVGVEKG